MRQKKEITVFILDTNENKDGVSFCRQEPTMGMFGAPVCDMYFDNVWIPAANRVTVGDGFKAAMIGLTPDRCALSALAIGIA
jgi:alkylation response protein AidB-like acyl-CoA dehydrogenase